MVIVLNQYEIAILRILLKSSSMLKVSQIVNGFPDDSKDEVVLAIYNLIGQGYLSTVETPAGVYTSLKKDKRREVLDIASPCMRISHNTEEDAQQQQQQEAPTTTMNNNTGPKVQYDGSGGDGTPINRSSSQLLPALTTLMAVGIIGICAASVAIISVFAIYQMSPSYNQIRPITADNGGPPLSAVEIIGEEPSSPLAIIRENGSILEHREVVGDVLPAIIPAARQQR